MPSHDIDSYDGYTYKLYLYGDLIKSFNTLYYRSSLIQKTSYKHKIISLVHVGECYLTHMVQYNIVYIQLSNTISARKT